jgi:hypothetical protein
MKGIQFFFKSPFYCFHGNCGKDCPIDSDLFGLSRSTGCGCCSLGVDFFKMAAVAMETVKMLKKLKTEKLS